MRPSNAATTCARLVLAARNSTALSEQTGIGSREKIEAGGCLSRWSAAIFTELCNMATWVDAVQLVAYLVICAVDAGKRATGRFALDMNIQMRLVRIK
jgi:hypothetical protein